MASLPLAEITAAETALADAVERSEKNTSQGLLVEEGWIGTSI